MKSFDTTNVQESYSGGESKHIPAGGYVARIMKVTDVPLDTTTNKGDYLKIEFDIAEGEYAGYYSELFMRFGKWRGNAIASYKETALPIFKGFYRSVEDANPNYTWNWIEQTLVGKLVGVVLGDEEYFNSFNNTIGTAVKHRGWCKVQDVRDGKVKAPKLRPMSESDKAKAERAGATTSAGATVISGADAELPF
jgi:hypothetical protein